MKTIEPTAYLRGTERSLKTDQGLSLTCKLQITAGYISNVNNNN